MIAIRRGSLRSWLPHENARYRAANGLESGKMSSSAMMKALPRACVILTHHKICAIRFRPGTRKPRNHQGDIVAALSNGKSWNTGTHTSGPGSVPLFLQINEQQ